MTAKHPRTVSVLLILSLAIAISAVLSLALGAVKIPPGEVLKVFVPGQAPVKASHQTIVWSFRLPRVLLALIVGGSLGAAGAAFQGLFQNPLAEPYIMGASSGAAVGALLVITGTPMLGGISAELGAFVGALGAVLIVYAVAETSDAGSITALLLAGVALSTMLSALVSLIMLFNSEDLHRTFSWLLGGLGSSMWNQVGPTCALAAGGTLVLWSMARPLDALSCGDETAQTLGLNLQQARILIVAAASLSTAAAVSASGIIGFVGLIAPHIARVFMGASHARVIPVSALVGALLLLIADTAARTLLAPIELPVGVLTAIVGGPFFLYLLVSGRWHS